MNDKIKRQKIVERDDFTLEEKEAIGKKSDNRCCHCGKKVYFKYGATVEHFIPLSKGGTNRDINMVMLCYDCNQKKSNYIYTPSDYLPYLKKEHLDKLNGYFESYIRSFDFVNRDNLLACDRYKIFINNLSDSLYYSNKLNKTKRKDLIRKTSSSAWVKKATFDDEDKICDYYIKYLKKYNCLDSEKDARINIQFWLTFGCIYYIEKNNDIKAFITVSVTKSNGRVTLMDDSIDYFLTVNIFAYYSTENALGMAWNLSRNIPMYLSIEQGLSQMPVRYCVLTDDELCKPLCNQGVVYEEDRFTSSFLVLYLGEAEDLPKLKDDKDLSKFFSKFNEINQNRFDKWFKKHDTENIEWMIDELELLPLEKHDDENEED